MRSNLSKFNAIFTVNAFINEYALFWDIISNHCLYIIHWLSNSSSLTEILLRAFSNSVALALRKGQEDKNSILSFGLTEIDSVMGEMRRGNLIGILGPPKGGKTRMANYLVQRALQDSFNLTLSLS